MFRALPIVVSLSIAFAVSCATTSRGSNNQTSSTVSTATFKVVSVTQGDAACYVELSSANGETKSYPSSFDFCPGSPNDATPLIGKEVTATFEKISIAAAECQGDPECTKTQEVEGVASLTAK